MFLHAIFRAVQKLRVLHLSFDFPKLTAPLTSLQHIILQVPSMSLQFLCCASLCVLPV